MGTKSYGYNNADLLVGDAATGTFGSFNSTYSHDSRHLLVSESRTGLSTYNKSYQYDGMSCRTQKIDNGTATC